MDSRPALFLRGRRPSSLPRERADSRHIPAEVKRVVWLRDLGRCAFVSPSGHRCAERGFVEFHHVQPFAAGGEATVDNVELRCRRHNAHEAALYFGRRKANRGDGFVREEPAPYGLRPFAIATSTRSGTSWSTVAQPP